MSWQELKNLDESENCLKTAMAGKRLICEVKFDDTDINAVKDKLLPLGLDAWDYPSLAAVMTVGIGIYSYSGGHLWDSFGANINTQRWGSEFEDFLNKHESLEKFAVFKVKEQAHRFVAPILAHGGIPQHCLQDFFSLITHRANPEWEGQEIIVYLKGHENYLVTIDVPVKRFLFYGGEVAEDFITRFTDLWQAHIKGETIDKAFFGLPERVVKAFNDWYSQNQHSINVQSGKRFPKPAIFIDQDSLSIVLFLPRCDDHPDINPNQHVWECNALDSRRRAVTREWRISLSPNEKWSVACANFITNFTGITEYSPVLFFDSDTGRMINDPAHRRLPQKVLAVYRKGTSTNPAPEIVDEVSIWADYQIAAFDLSNHNQIEIDVKSFEVKRPFFRRKEESIIPNVRTDDGFKIYNKLPLIEWDGRANLSLSKEGSPLGNMDIEKGDIPLLIDKPGKYEMCVRGPLGEKITDKFAFIPGLKVIPDSKIAWPNTNFINWDVSVENGNIRIHDHQRLSTTFQVAFDDITIDVVAEAPHFKWRLELDSSESEVCWDTKPISIQLKDLHEARTPLLVCSLGNTEEEFDVSLEGRHGAVSPPQGRQTKISNHSWCFDLRQVKDDVEMSGKAEEFDLLVRSRDGRLLYKGASLSVRPKWDIQGFSATSSKKEDQEVIHVCWREQGQVISGRYLAIVPVWRPWEDTVLVHKLEDNERHSFQWSLPTSGLRPGRYHVLAAHSPWGQPSIWHEVTPLEKKTIDVNKQEWSTAFASQQEKVSVETYFESLLAYWNKPQEVQPPTVPTSLSAEQIKQLLNYFEKSNKMEEIKPSRNMCTAIYTLFCNNSKATSEAIRQVLMEYSEKTKAEMPEIWKSILPSLDIILLDLNSTDKQFVRGIGYNYDILRSAAQRIRKRYPKANLSEPLQDWHRKLKNQEAPPAKDIFFLYEKFKLFEHDEVVKPEYERIKAECLR